MSDNTDDTQPETQKDNLDGEAMLVGSLVADLIRRGWRVEFVLDGQRTTVDVVVNTINH